MGLADLGRGSGGAYVYDTSGFMASVTFHPGLFSVYNPGYTAFAEAPDWAAIQLNTVAVNVSYPREPTGTNGTFWVQNVVHINGTAVQFEDNIWNFTGSLGLNAGTLLNPLGTLVPGNYYYRFGPTLAVTYPFTLDLYNNISLVDHRATVYLNYSVTTGSGQRAGSYDTVTFRQTQTTTPSFQVNGTALDGAGHANDAELTFGGDGGGSNTMVTELNATASLQFWNASLGSYSSVPSAYDHGEDSGETSEGIAATYVGTTEELEQGPSMLYGLWHTTLSSFGPPAAPGAIRVALTVSPTWAFVFATDNRSFTGRPLAEMNLAYFPTDVTGAGSTELPPPSASDPYKLLAWAAGYANSSRDPTNVTGNSTGLALQLSETLSSPMQAPLYLVGDAQTITFGTLGIASVSYDGSDRTLSLAPSSDALAPPFLQLNDYRFPTFLLFAASELNVSVTVNGFEQAPGASSYTLDQGGGVAYPGYSQGYFFFYDHGSCAVSNTTLPGNSTAYWENQAYPPAAVDFYETPGGRASNIVSTQESFGVAYVNSTGGTVTNLTSEDGANALDVIYSADVDGTDVKAVGLDYRQSPSWGAYLLNASAVDLRDLSAVNQSVALEGSNASWAVSSLTVDNATAIQAFNGSSSTVTGLDVADSNSVAYAGYWDNSTDLSVVGLSVVGLGFELEYDSHLSAVGINVSGLGSVGVYDFSGSSTSSFSHVNVTDGALGLNLSDAMNVSVSSVVATGGSVGVYLLGTNGTEASGVRASDLSAGFVWQFGVNVTIEGAQASDESIAVVATNGSNVNVSQVTASNGTLGPPYFTNPAMGFLLPNAAVMLGNDSNASVTDVSADGFAFAVQANYTNETVLRDVTAWNGDVAVSLNATNNTTVSSLFSFGEVVGVDNDNSTNVTLVSSTLEDSVLYGFASLNGSMVAVDDNNFVANNGASATGAFSGAHVQASVDGTVEATFSSNYWSDAAGRSSYVVNRTRIDRTPLADFAGHWLVFQESGLPTGDGWAFGILGALYRTTTPMVYLPSWTVPRGIGLPFFVLSTHGYVATPSSGSVTFSGANATVAIQFNSTTTASGASGGFPLWAGAAAAGAGVVIVAAVALSIRRSKATGPR
jgi:hypothetical protein